MDLQRIPACLPELQLRIQVIAQQHLLAENPVEFCQMLVAASPQNDQNWDLNAVSRIQTEIKHTSNVKQDAVRMWAIVLSFEWFKIKAELLLASHASGLVKIVPKTPGSMYDSGESSGCHTAYMSLLPHESQASCMELAVLAGGVSSEPPVAEPQSQPEPPLAESSESDSEKTLTLPGLD